MCVRDYRNFLIRIQRSMREACKEREPKIIFETGILISKAVPQQMLHSHKY